MGFGSFKLTGENEVNNNMNKSDEADEKRKREINNLVHDALNDVIDNTKIKINKTGEMEKSSFIQEVIPIVNETLDKSEIHLSLTEKQNVTNYIMDEIFGYGPITPLLKDPTISEVMVNGPDNVYIERAWN